MSYTKDLFDKLVFPVENFSGIEDDLYQEINEIINGRIIFDTMEKDFVYLKNSNKIPIKNTATGIKSFGLLQMLIRNNFINRKSILIIDEPEVHLHPKWQLKYAQIIIALIKSNVDIIVASHSPYMIEALKRYSDIAGLSKKANFYLSQDEKIENENNLEEIFEILSEPFEEFRRLDASMMKS